MEVSITEDCIACEKCVVICPYVFDMGEEFAVVTANPIPEEHFVAVREAADECPTDAIIIEE